MSDTARTTPSPISQSHSYINRLPPELLETICDFLRARPSAKYLVRTRPPVVDRYNYWTNPIDTASYVRARRALRALCLVSTRFRGVAQRQLFNEIWITDLQSLFGLVISLGLYPHNRAHIKHLGISEAFFINCQENDCECGGTIEGCYKRNRHHVNWGTDKDLEYTCWGVFNTVLKVPSVLWTFPDVRQILEIQQELEVRLTDGWHWMSDATFEQVCNLALKLLVFFSPDLRSLRFTAPLGTASSPYILRYVLGLIPLPTTSLGGFTIPIPHAHSCAQFLTRLSIDLSSLHVCYGRHLLDGYASRCLT